MTIKKLTAAICFVAMGAAAPALYGQGYDPQQGQQGQQGGQPPQGQQQGGQQGGQQYNPAAQQQQGAEVSDADLEKYAKAETKVDSIREDFSEQLQGADDQEQAQQLQQQAQEEMISAVEDAGLDVTTYNQIASQVQMDDSLRERLQQVR